MEYLNYYGLKQSPTKQKHNEHNMIHSIILLCQWCLIVIGSHVIVGWTHNITRLQCEACIHVLPLSVKSINLNNVSQSSVMKKSSIMSSVPCELQRASFSSLMNRHNPLEINRPTKQIIFHPLFLYAWCLLRKLT